MRPRETIFDQSMATQERIDIILKFLHDNGMRPRTMEMIDIYQRNIIRLKKEAQTKFTKKEHQISQDFIMKINEIRGRWNNVLYALKKGNNYPIALTEIFNVLDNYEDWLYITLDRHGMLMKDRAHESNATRV